MKANTEKIKKEETKTAGENFNAAVSETSTKTSAKITAETTLNELIRFARNDAVEKPKTTPKFGTLRKKANCVASYHSDDHRSSLFVYDNGFAAYKTDGKTTAIDLDKIFAVEFPSNIYSCELTAEDIKNLPWAVALTSLGEERVAQNIFEDEAHELVGEGENEDNEAKKPNTPAFAVHIDDPETAYIRKETRNEIKMALSKARGQMTEEQGEAFALYYDQDMSLKEIGKILKISSPAVFYRINGAKQKLRKNMEQFL